MRTCVFLSVLLIAYVLADCQCTSYEPCCSQYGYCGTTAAYCDKNQGCKSGCWSSSSGTGSSGKQNSTSGGGSSGGSSTGGGGGSNGLTDCQQEIIFRVTSVFETGSQDLNFAFCDYESDGQGYDAGFMSATSHSGAILGIVQYYCKSKPSDGICNLQNALKQAVGSSTKNGLGGLCSAWKSASNVKEFRNAQWQYTIDNYFSPATTHAKQIGLTLPLGLGQLYDTNIQLGDGNDQNSLGGIINTVNNRVGKPASAGQTQWLSAFLQERINAENRIGGAYPQTVYRMNSYKHVIAKGQAAMTGKTVEFLDNSGNPMSVTCKGNLH